MTQPATPTPSPRDQHDHLTAAIGEVSHVLGKLKNNLAYLKLDADYLLNKVFSPHTRALIGSGSAPEHDDEAAWWDVGYYRGLLRGIEILEDYKDEHKVTNQCGH